MKDPLLLPSILPNIFNISSTLDATQFQTLVLPSLKPLFAIKEPPQNMITLLENLKALQEKTAKSVFRQGELSSGGDGVDLSHTDHTLDVLPLVYNALESEHAEVQERALKAVPDLCETIDYAEVQGILFPRVAVRISLSFECYDSNICFSLSLRKHGY
jgi:SCY1-like protein 2